MSTNLAHLAKENIAVGVQHAKQSALTRNGSKKNLIPAGKTKTGLSARPAFRDLDQNKQVPTKLPQKHLPVKAEVKPKAEPSFKNLPASLEIDEKYKDDPQQVSEYAQDIQRYLLEAEVSFAVKANFLEKHATSPVMRSMLVEWMISAIEHFSLSLESMYLSVWIVDKYLESHKDVGKTTLQLVGSTAMFTASKYEDVYLPPLEDFAYICEDIFTKKDILKMELKILSCLQMKLGRPHAITFLRRYSKIARASLEQHTLAKYLLELALLDYKFVAIKPSMLASAALCTSISILTSTEPNKNWSEQLTAGSSYVFKDFKTIVGRLAKLLLFCDSSAKDTNKDFKFQGVLEKYAHAKLLKISLNHKLKGLFVSKIVSLCSD